MQLEWFFIFAALIFKCCAFEGQLKRRVAERKAAEPFLGVHDAKTGSLGTHDPSLPGLANNLNVQPAALLRSNATQNDTEVRADSASSIFTNISWNPSSGAIVTQPNHLPFRIARINSSSQNQSSSFKQSLQSNGTAEETGGQNMHHSDTPGAVPVGATPLGIHGEDDKEQEPEGHHHHRHRHLPCDHDDYWEEAREQESFALAIFLMGSVSALMFNLHLLHCRWATIRHTTLRVLNMTTSIFASVLGYGALRSTLVGIFHPGYHAGVTMTLVMFFVLYIFTSFLLFKIRGGDDVEMKAVGTIFAHVTGFAGMYGFSDLREVEFFEEHKGIGFMMVIGIAAVIIPGMSFVMNHFERKIALYDDVVDEDEELWMETAKEADDDVLCLTISFLGVGYIRYNIRGKMMPYEPGLMGDVSQHQCNLLLCTVLFSAFLVFLWRTTMKHYRKTTMKHFRGRPSHIVQNMCSSMMAWSGLFWAEWQLYVLGWESTVIGGCLVVAVFLSWVGLGIVFILDAWLTVHESCVATQKAVRALELALGVLVGFSWERAFDVGFEEIAAKASRVGHGWAKDLIIVVMSTLMFMIVFPAWRFYILPHTLAMQAQDKISARTGTTEGSSSQRDRGWSSRAEEIAEAGIDGLSQPSARSLGSDSR